MDDSLADRPASEKAGLPVATLAFRLGSGDSVEPDPPSIAPVKGNSLKLEPKPQPVVVWVGEPNTISKITYAIAAMSILISLVQMLKIKKTSLFQ